MPDTDLLHLGVDHGRFFGLRPRLLEAAANNGDIFIADPIAAIVGHVLRTGGHHDSPDSQTIGVDIDIQAVSIAVPGANALRWPPKLRSTPIAAPTDGRSVYYQTPSSIRLPEVRSTPPSKPSPCPASPL